MCTNVEGYERVDDGADDRDLAMALLLGNTSPWDAGAPEKIPPGSWGWRALDTYSAGRFSAWRRQVAILRAEV